MEIFDYKTFYFDMVLKCIFDSFHLFYLKMTLKDVFNFFHIFTIFKPGDFASKPVEFTITEDNHPSQPPKYRFSSAGIKRYMKDEDEEEDDPYLSQKLRTSKNHDFFMSKFYENFQFFH